jgi:Flp pilus assembly protein TadB
MDSPDKKARELRHKEQELRKREQEIRVRELEAEIDRSVPEYRTTKYEEPDSQVKEGKLQQWRRKIIAVAQFTGIVIAVVVAVRIATWLATVVIVGGIALIAYQMFFCKRQKLKTPSRKLSGNSHEP